MDNFDSYLSQFYKITPNEFRRALEERQTAAATMGGS
jgi:hypothetical protein